jgi:hypothetical protein
LNPESQLIELKAGKNKIGELFRMCIRPDFDEGSFEITDSPQFTKRTAEIQKLADIIAKSPGVNQNGIIEVAGMKTKRVLEILRQGIGTSWDTQAGPNRSKNYYPIGYFPRLGNTQGNEEIPGEQSAGVSGVSLLKGGKHGNTSPKRDAQVFPPANGNGKELPKCGKCGSNALYRNLDLDGSYECMTCEDVNPINDSKYV